AGQVKCFTQFVARQADEKRLPERRKQGQEKAAADPAGVLLHEIKHGRAVVNYSGERKLPSIA
ncbi:hypothetical protein, partial [Mesorhizobium sp. A623]